MERATDRERSVRCPAGADATTVDGEATGTVIRGVVEHGRRLGRELGFPTANLHVGAQVDAPDGVYASHATVDGVLYRSMSNLGCNPSVGGDERRLETHLFGFEGSLYGRELQVELLVKIRDERTFATVEELRAQIEKDKVYILGLKDEPGGTANNCER